MWKITKPGTMKELLGSYDSCKLECDGLTRVLTTVLQREGIEHTCMVGSIQHTGRDVGMSPHFWIELPDMRLIDYRAQMWLGDSPDIPHGIFIPAEFPLIVYEGQRVIIEPLPQFLFDILTTS